MPAASLTRFMIAAANATPTIDPTTTPTTRIGSFCLPPRFHESALDSTRARVSERPAVAIPNRPAAMASHGVVAPCENAPSIWLANEPVKPTSDDIESRPACRPSTPATPTANSTSGTKKVNSRSDRALPSSVPAACLSRSWIRTAMSIAVTRLRRSSSNAVPRPATSWTRSLTRSVIPSFADDAPSSSISDSPDLDPAM